jgi:hypothetical protein
MIVNNLSMSGGSSITAHHCHFFGRFIPDSDLAPIISGNETCAVFANERDPINPSEVSGRYVGATQFKYRGVIEDKVESNHFTHRICRSAALGVIK